MVVVVGGAVVVETLTRKTDRPCVLFVVVVVGSKFDRRVPYDVCSLRASNVPQTGRF